MNAQNAAIPDEDSAWVKSHVKIPVKKSQRLLTSQEQWL